MICLLSLLLLAYQTQANLSGADLRDADLRFATLSQTIIDPDTLLDPKWVMVWEIVNQGAAGRDLNGVDLSVTNLLRADLSGANLRHADLSLAHLRQSNLSGASLHGADLRGAEFFDTRLTDARYNETTRWPGFFDPQAAGAIKRKSIDN